MLIRFNVKNYLSFSSREDGTSEEFSMIAGKMKSKKEHLYEQTNAKLLKFAAVYGANAAGKSNLVKALDFMKDTVIDGLPEKAIEQYCKVDIKNKEKPSYFELEIRLEEKVYSYGFEVILSKRKFISEWFCELKPDGNDKTIFERDILAGTYDLEYFKKSKELYTILQVYMKEIRDDSSILFLKMMNQNKKNLYNEHEMANVLRIVYRWIEKKLDINYPDQPISDYSYMVRADNVEEVCNIISSFGTGITGFELKEVPPERVMELLPESIKKKLESDIEKGKEKIESNKKIKSIGIALRSSYNFFVIRIYQGDIKCETIQFNHGRDNVFFNIGEESDGTVRVLDLIEILLDGEGKTYIIDELDRCLHPNLTYRFVQQFLQYAKERNVQLVVTTHESRLMDFKLLRRDEIWFADKRRTGETDLYSLEEYNARFDSKVDKAYLEGRYGGVPVFSTLFPVQED